MKKYIAIDIGGTNTKIGLITADGTIVTQHAFPTGADGDDPARFLHRLDQQIGTLLQAEVSSLAGIGISAHGYLDDERNGPIVCHNTPALQGFNLRHWARERYQLPVVVNNDLTAHALGEYHFGCGQGVGRFLNIAIGTGLGAGVIIDGKPLRFIGGKAGDTGRIILDPSGPLDVYGVPGTAEALCGVGGIELLARHYYGADQTVTAYQVITACANGDDPLASEIITIVGRYIGQLAASLYAIFVPQRIALTGGTTAAGETLLSGCRQRFDELIGVYHGNLAPLHQNLNEKMQTAQTDRVDIVIGSQGVEAGMRGAIAELIFDY